MTPEELAQQAVKLADGITADTWCEEAKQDLIKALLRLRRVCAHEGISRAMHEAEEWISVLQVCETHRDFAVSRARDAVHGIARMVRA